MITEAQAEALLQADIEIAERAIDELVMVPLNERQFSALVSFVFNLGALRLKDSTLLRLLNEGDYAGAADQFLRWCHAKGVLIASLEDRRAAERALFLS